jgi:adenylate cyclase
VVAATPLRAVSQLTNAGSQSPPTCAEPSQRSTQPLASAARAAQPSTAATIQVFFIGYLLGRAENWRVDRSVPLRSLHSTPASRRMPMQQASICRMVRPPPEGGDRNPWRWRRTNRGEVLAELSPMVQRAVVLADLVESVRLMQTAERDVIARWLAFMSAVREQVLKERPHARLVKSLGDGLLIETEDAEEAVDIAFELLTRIEAASHGLAPDRQLRLRIGLNHAPLVVDELDVFGSGVNLAARLARLAQPGQVVVSDALWSRLPARLQQRCEDLGLHYLKHLDRPVHAYRLHTRRTAAASAAPPPADAAPPAPDAMPALAVLRFASADGPEDGVDLGEIVAEDLTAALSRSPLWQVTSRLSSAQHLYGADAPQLVARRLGVRYLVGGTLRKAAGRLRLYCELCDAIETKVLWAETQTLSIERLFRGTRSPLHSIVGQVTRALIGHEIELALERPLSALQARGVLLRAVATMHRMSLQESELALAALEHVIERHPRRAAGHAWLAKWHLIRLAQAWSPDPAADATSWKNAARTALECEPENALGRALLGHAHAFVDRDLDKAGAELDAALAADPNEALAWLFRSSVHAHRGEGTAAVGAMRRALAISPIDPMRYFFDAFAAMASLAADDYAAAREQARSSVRLNPRHLPSWVELAIAASLDGAGEEAQAAGREILRLRPAASVARFVAHHPAGEHPLVGQHAAALRAAGVPD